MNQTELEKRVVNLLQRIARINKANEKDNKKLGDVVQMGPDSHFVVSIHVTNIYQYFLVDTHREELDKLCAEISKSNEKVESAQDVRTYLNELIGQIRQRDWQTKGILRDVRSALTYIKENTGETAYVTFPVWGLILADTPLVVGDVEFRPRPVEKEIEDLLHKLDPDRIVQTVARTTARGNRKMMPQNAETQVTRAINIVRAFTCSVLAIGGCQEISIEGDHLLLHSLVIEHKKLSQEVEGETNITGAGLHMTGGLQPIIITKVVKQLMDSKGFTRLLEQMQKPDKFSQGLVRAAEWIGEATKHDVLPAKFVKVAFAIDAMIGDESGNIPDKGKKARIAERSAFLLGGKRYVTRNRVRRDIVSFIGKRDDIAHGSTKTFVTDYDLNQIAKYAMRLLRRLLVEEPKFSSIVKLGEWVQRQSLLG